MTARLGTNEARGVERFDGVKGYFVGDVQIRSAKTLQNWDTAFTLPPGGGSSGIARANAVASVLNGIFADANHDADFFTPTFAYPGVDPWLSGAYSVSFAHVHGTDTCNTTFAVHPNTIPECLYAACGVPNCTFTYAKASKAQWQTDILYIRPEDQVHYNDVPWDLALFFANQIRSRIDGIDARGRAIQSLIVSGLSNYAGDIQKLCRFYLAGEVVNNPWTACFGGAETGHTLDLTLATDSAALPCNMWIRVSLGSLTVVVRATDDSPVGQVEGTAGGVATALQLSTACAERTVRLHQP